MNMANQRKLKPLRWADTKKHSMAEYRDMGRMIYGLTIIPGVVWTMNRIRKSINRMMGMNEIIRPASPSAVMAMMQPYRIRYRDLSKNVYIV